MPCRPRQGSYAAHEGSTDSENVYVHDASGHRSRSRIEQRV